MLDTEVYNSLNNFRDDPRSTVVVLIYDFLWPPYAIGQAIIFLPCGFFFFFFYLLLSVFFLA